MLSYAKIFGQYVRYSIYGRKELKHVHTLAFFIGHGRTGHSLVGHLLNNHRNIFMAHEFNFFNKLYNKLYDGSQYKNSHHLLYEMLDKYDKQYKNNNKSSAMQNTGYHYPFFGSVRIKDKQIKIIGDKTGGHTAKIINKFGNDTLHHLQSLGYHLKLIHLMRNPFDVIATYSIRRLEIITRKQKKIEINEQAIAQTLVTLQEIYPDPEQFHQLLMQHRNIVIDKYFSRCGAIDNLQRSQQFKIHNMHYHKLVQQPKSEMRTLLTFLNVEASEDYLENCNQIIKPTKASRYLYPRMYGKDTIKYITERIKHTKNMEGYSYDSL